MRQLPVWTNIRDPAAAVKLTSLAPEMSRPADGNSPTRSSMSLIQAIAATMPSTGSRVRGFVGRAASTVATVSGRVVAMALPPTRRESRVIGLVGIVLVLFIVAFTNLVLREIADSSRDANQAHVEQLVKAVTFAARRAIVAAAVIGSVMVMLFTFLLANRARRAATQAAAAETIRARMTAALNTVPVELI